MKIKLSKKQWQEMGKKAGWLKKANDLEALHEQYRSQMQSAAPVYVSLYEVERAYGGPEEGGWWYNNWTLLSSKKFFDAEEAEKFAAQLNGEVESSGANEESLSSARGMDQYPDPNRGDPMADASDSDIPVGFAGLATNQRVMVEQVAGENETKETPHYE